MSSGRIVNVRPKPGYVMDGGGTIVPAPSNVVVMRDKLSNVMSGKGTTADRSVYAGYNFVPVTPEQAEAAYRTSWLMRKIVDIPPLDMTRAWRQWQAEDTDIEALEREERRLAIRDKCKRALTLARLYGGGAIVLGVAGQEPAEELKPVGKGELLWAHVFSRYQLQVTGQMVTDPASPWFGMPEQFTLSNAHGQSIVIHPSRVIAFVGQKLPEGTLLSGGDWFWGDPLYQSIEDALKNADLAQDGFAALIDEAKVDVIQIPDLMANVGTTEYETRLLQRLGLAQRGKSIHRALMLDGAEEWHQKQIAWSGMPEIMASYLQFVAGAADIPITRLLGQSPKGLQSTGEGEERDYHAMIAARQEELLAPALDRIDEVLIPSALGSRPSDVYYTFRSLERLSPKDAAEIESKRATTIKTYADTGLIVDEALAEMAKNAIVESGQWPGSEAAFEATEGMEPEEVDESEGLTAEEREQRAAANDAAPRPLYVQRKLLNAHDLIAWAKAQGFDTTLPADDMHVTVLYSRKPVDPMKMGETWTSEQNGGLVVKAGGPRAIEKLGESAVVLLFASWAIESRHREMIEAGGSHDWPEYQPHVTLSYEAPADLDLDAIKPFTGELRFGPELFEPLDEDWKSGISEA
jgi:phage-related protein (TIGR01555 family)